MCHVHNTYIVHTVLWSTNSFSSELFTNCLDMLASLLHSLPTDFHICLAGSGEEGKKTHTTCIKKLKSELSNAKSACLSEIQQLFPLAQRPFEVITVKPPAFNMPKAPGDKIVVCFYSKRGNKYKCTCTCTCMWL